MRLKYILFKEKMKYILVGLLLMNGLSILGIYFIWCYYGLCIFFILKYNSLCFLYLDFWEENFRYLIFFKY